MSQTNLQTIINNSKNALSAMTSGEILQFFKALLPDFEVEMVEALESLPGLSRNIRKPEDPTLG